MVAVEHLGAEKEQAGTVSRKPNLSLLILLFLNRGSLFLESKGLGGLGGGLPQKRKIIFCNYFLAGEGEQTRPNTAWLLTRKKVEPALNGRRSSKYPPGVFSGIIWWLCQTQMLLLAVLSSPR